MIQTVTLETAKLLKEAGFTQVSSYWYQNAKYNIPDEPIRDCWCLTPTYENWDDNYEKLAAPTTDKLLSELPWQINFTSLSKPKGLHIGKGNSFYDVRYYEYGYYSMPLNFTQNKSLPEALASMWLYLKKEGLL